MRQETALVRLSLDILVAPLPPHSPIGIYVHIPFCAHICPYCDFNTYAGQSNLIPHYVDALCQDLRQEGARVGRRPVASIFFGGGTPSLLSAAQISQVMATIREQFDVSEAIEVSLEANPNGLTEQYLAELRTAGINRLSIGMQTTDRRGLRRLGRMHEASDAQQAVEAAQRVGFNRLSVDLIFGWPGQTMDSWIRDLETVLGWGDSAIDHLSLYSLIVEPGTPMADAVQRGITIVPNDDETADLYEAAIAFMAGAGMVHYEVANWARSEASMSTHNAVYWRNGEYLGIGAGAHGRVGDVRTMRHLLPATYIRELVNGETGVSNSETLEVRTSQAETMMLGLRLLREGVTHDEFRARYGVGLVDVFGAVIAEQTKIGLLDHDDRGVRLTQRGLLLANDVCAAYLP